MLCKWLIELLPASKYFLEITHILVLTNINPKEIYLRVQVMLLS